MKVLSGQSVIDLAIQSSGSIEAAVELATLNGLSLSDSLTAGATLEESTVVSSEIVDYYDARGLLPATALTDTGDTSSDLGIEYWTIETDFIVN